MKFNAKLSYIIPGNFLNWNIVLIDGISKKVKIPSDYEVNDVEKILKTINVHIPQTISWDVPPKIHNAKALSNAVFEFEKTAHKKFRVLRYIGELRQDTNISIDTKPAGEANDKQI